MRSPMRDTIALLMELIWKNQPVTTQDMGYLSLMETCFNRSTTYLVLRDMVDLGYIRQDGPEQICTALITPEEFWKIIDEDIDRKYRRP